MKNIPNPQEINSLVALLSEGRYSEAATHAQKLTVRFPLHAFGWMMLGVSFGQMGRNADALASLKKAAALSPNDAGVHINLGKILQDLGRQAEAEVCFRRALKIKPDIAEAHSNLGKILQDFGHHDEAEKCFRRALKIKPDFSAAHCNLGNTLSDLGRLDEAEACYRRALSLNPNYADAYGNLGGLLLKQGKQDAALACFQHQIRLSPENGEARHLVAALTGENTERAPNQYIEKIFDGYADKFDTHLQQVLKYNSPEKLVALVTKHSKPPAEKWRVLDLGCGTGLVGFAVAPFARQLVGVDLSTKMLEKAHARNLYQRLERMDLVTMMHAEKSASYDVIFAADVFIYLGKLDEIVSEIKRLLCPGGFVAFSIEDLETSSNEKANQGDRQEYQLNSTGRYSQSASYIAKLAASNGFMTLEMAATHLRTEHGNPVNGHLVLWSR